MNRVLVMLDKAMRKLMSMRVKPIKRPSMTLASHIANIMMMTTHTTPLKMSNRLKLSLAKLSLTDLAQLMIQSVAPEIHIKNTIQMVEDKMTSALWLKILAGKV